MEGRGGKEGGKKGGRATEFSRYTRASKQEFSRFPGLPEPSGSPRASPGLVPFDHFKRNSWVDVNWTFFKQLVIFLVLQIAKQLCFSCARFWSLWLGLCFGLQNSCATLVLFVVL